MKLTEKTGALLALALAQGAPLGLLVLYHLVGGVPPRLTTMLYIWIGTSVVMGAFGWTLGRQLHALAEANLQLEALARQDALTGLANARALNEELSREVIHAARTDQPLSLIIFDLDHFKTVNDNYGHQMGDNVLKGIGRLVREHARADELAARYGGEELALVLPNTREDQAALTAERLRERIETASQQGRLPVPITSSFGVAQLDTGETAFALFARADRALYKAKHSGRNCVRLASRLSTSETANVV